jgi:NTE family protein
MLVLPADLSRYRLPGTDHPIEPDQVRIADAVRMSMSIPFFFQPVLLESVETGEICTIVDGAILSNFPVWLFDVDRDLRRPTFGFHLIGGKAVGQGFAHILETIGWPVKLGVDMVRTASEAWDDRFMSHSTVVRTCPVPSGSIAATDFSLTGEDQRRLMEGGRQAAITFLDNFQTGDYVNTFGQKLVE